MRFPGNAVSLVTMLLLSISIPAFGHSVGEEMAGAATNWLAALTPEQKAKAVFELTDGERLNWHFVPRPRKGLALRDMTLTQQQLAHVLILTPLSHRGHFKTVTIMSLDQVLYDLENRAARREPGQYYISIFGTPAKEPWGWRIEGHHLSLNFVVGSGTVSTTPSFLGANPAEVKGGPRRGLRILAREEDLARMLIQSLSEKQLAIAIFAADAPRDIFTGTNRQITALQPMGISAAELNHKQRTVFMELLREFVFRYRDELAGAEWKKIEKAGADKLYFAWAGGIEPGQGHYYRIQGPTFLMEYDKTQDNANHIHTVWRDFENDFGEDLLRKHYEQVPHGKIISTGKL